MSTSQRSYYEIALTNRQVLIAFSILLGCVVTAFVSGLWVGRQAAVRTSEVDVVDASAQTPPGTYRFFGEESPSASQVPPVQQAATALPAATPPPRPTAQPTAQPTASQPTASQPTASQPTASQPTASQPTASETEDLRSPGAPERPRASPRPSAAEPEVRGQAPSPADSAASLPSGAAASPPARESASPTTEEQAAAAEVARRRVVDPPATSELSVIQVFSTADEAQARSVLDRLKGGGFRAFLSPVQVDGRTMYRVRVGPFRERAAAESEAAKLKQLYKLDTWITN